MNTLSQAQQNTRVEADLSNEDDANTYVMYGEDCGDVYNRQTIKAGSNPANGAAYTFSCDFDDDNTGNEANDGEWIGMNYFCWMDLCAYADWAGLRPMTELEFEKACRGTLSAVRGEYAWGTTSYTEATSLSNAGQSSEVADQTGNGLCNYGSSGLGGPCRVGFAATGNTTRETAGATYYGIMEMTGNAWELAATLGNSTGRIFQGTHGDGVLTTAASYEGNATNTDWPGINDTQSMGVTNSSGDILRGGTFDINGGSGAISIRESYGSAARSYRVGGRLARTAP